MRIQGGSNNFMTSGNSQVIAKTNSMKLTTSEQKLSVDNGSNKLSKAVDNKKVNQGTAEATATTDAAKKPVTADELRATFQKDFSDLLKSGKDFDTTFKEAEKLFGDYFSAMRGLSSTSNQGSSALDSAQSKINANSARRISFEDSTGSINNAEQNVVRNNIDISVNMSNNITNAASRINDIKNVEMEQVNQMQIGQSVLAQANQASQTVLGLMN